VLEITGIEGILGDPRDQYPHQIALLEIWHRIVEIWRRGHCQCTADISV